MKCLWSPKFKHTEINCNTLSVNGSRIYLKKYKLYLSQISWSLDISFWLHFFAVSTPKSLTFKHLHLTVKDIFIKATISSVTSFFPWTFAYALFSRATSITSCLRRDPSEVIRTINLIRALRMTSTMDSPLLPSWQSSDIFLLEPKSWWREIPEQHPDFLRWDAYLLRLHQTVVVAYFKPSVKFSQWPHHGT